MSRYVCATPICCARADIWSRVCARQVDIAKSRFDHSNYSPFVRHGTDLADPMLHTDMLYGWAS